MWDKYIEQLPALSSGGYEEGSGSLCAMEMIAYMERLPHSDSPACTCPVLASYVRNLNDGMDDKARQKLLPVLPMLVGTVNDDLVVKRAQFLADAANERFVPMAGRASEEVWNEAIAVLVEAIELDAERVVAQWQAETIDNLIEDFA